MNLEKRGDLAKSEIFEIAGTLHVLMLNALFRQTRMRAPDIVFHGGTSLKVARSSQRFSEDLDFMISPEIEGKLREYIVAAHRRSKETASVLYPGCELELKGPKEGDILRWQVRWTHPNKRTAVKVKIEFMIAEAELLRRYRSVSVLPTPDLQGSVRIGTSLPVPDLISAWADKIKAVASRPEMKWRDIYDLAYISDHLGKSRDDEAETTAVLGVGDLYRYSSTDLVNDLTTVLESGILDRLDLFEDDIRHWLHDDVWEDLQSAGLLSAMLAKGKTELVRALDIVQASLSQEIKP